MSDSEAVSNGPHGDDHKSPAGDPSTKDFIGRRRVKGIPDMLRAELLHGDERMRIGMRVPRGEVVPVEPLQAHLHFTSFGMCPICLSRDGLTREHVPPAAIGGRALTLTCQACNNIFGSRYEPALHDWYEDAMPGLRFAGEAVPGSRTVGRVLVRKNQNDEFVMIVSGGAPGVDELLNHGKLQMEYAYTRGYELRVAALKTAYLTCCLILGQVPTSPEAVQVREELLAARNLPKGVSPAPSGKLSSLKLTKTGQPPRPGEIHIIAARDDDDSLSYFLSFNRFWTISWPLEIAAVVLNDGGQHYVLGSDIPRRRGEGQAKESHD